MITLGIETSCDETAAAVVLDGKTVLSNEIATSQEMHAKTGGIIPEVAARQQLLSIMPVIESALKTAKVGMEDIDNIAVTYGPGLIGSLLVGVETARTLSLVYSKPIIPVNHLVGHIYANWIANSTKRRVQSIEQKQPEFPAVCLVVSGGHSDLVLMRGHGEIVWLGGTRDDAAGEAFDKTARLLGLPYPGGPSIAASAENFQLSNPGFQYKLLPRPMLQEDTYDFSFSGLKTAVLREWENRDSKLTRERMAAEVQEAITDVLTAKSIAAVFRYKPQSFLLAGGVAANVRLRNRLTDELSKQFPNVSLFIPPVKYCTDNASYIAVTSFYLPNTIPWEDVHPAPDLTISESALV